MKNRQPFNEADYTVLIETLGQVEIADPKRKRRVEVLARRLTEFRDDLTTQRVAAESNAKRHAEEQAKLPELAKKAAEEHRARILSAHDPDLQGSWVIFAPSQNLDLHGGSHANTYLGSFDGAWKDAVDKALEWMKGYFGDPIFHDA